MRRPATAVNGKRDDMLVDFSTLVASEVSLSGQSASLVVRTPYLGTPTVNIAQARIGCYAMFKIAEVVRFQEFRGFPDI
jgi:hypothetical protein